MVVKYLLATLSALAKKITSPSTMYIADERDAIYNNGINYLNVSPTFGRFQRRRKKMIDLLLNSIIMAIVLVAACFVLSNKAFANRSQVTNVTISGSQTVTIYY